MNISLTSRLIIFNIQPFFSVRDTISCEFPLENLSSLSRHFWRVLFRPQASGTNFATAQAIAPKVALCVCLGMLQPTLAQLDRWSLVLFDGCPRPCQSPADFTMQD